MFVIVWRRSGIAVLIYLALCSWIVSYWFEDTRLGNASYMGWVLFYTAIATGLHALALVALKNAPPDPQDPNDPDPDATPPAPIWHHSLFFIPVVIWPLIFGGISAKCLLGSDGTSDEPTEIIADQPEVKLEERTFYFLNPSEDTMVYVISSEAGVYDTDTLEPLTFDNKTYEPGTYLITAMNLQGETIYTFPSGDVTKDKKKCSQGKNGSGDKIFLRIVENGTSTRKDCDDVWVILNGSRDMMVVDVTEVCSDTVTQKGVESINWVSNVKGKYDGRDIVEPLYGKEPGKETYTLLTPGEDLPTQLKKNERVFALFSVSPDEALTSEYIAGRVLKRLPDIPEK